MDRTLTSDTTIEVLWDVALNVLRRDARSLVCDDADAGTIRLGATIAGTELTRHAVVEVGELRELGPHAVAVPVTWRAGEHEHRFPTVEGIFEVSGLSEHPPLTRLAFVGQHDAPLGILGTVGDAAGGRALATQSVQSLTERIGVRITDAVAAHVREWTDHGAPTQARARPAERFDD